MNTTRRRSSCPSIDPAALPGNFVAHLSVFRAHAANRGVDHRSLVTDRFPAHRSRGKRVFTNWPFERIMSRSSCSKCTTLPARWPPGCSLVAAANRPPPLPECVEPIYQHISKSVAIRDQQCYRRDSPHDAEHGQHAANTAALQRGPGFLHDFFNHAHALAARLVPQRFDGIHGRRSPRRIHCRSRIATIPSNRMPRAIRTPGWNQPGEEFRHRQ